MPTSIAVNAAFPRSSSRRLMKQFCCLAFVAHWITFGCLFCLLNFCFLESITASAAERTDQTLLDVFPPSVATVSKDTQGRTSISLEYTPSTSLWAKGLDEKTGVSCPDSTRTDENNSFTLRIGKGWTDLFPARTIRRKRAPILYWQRAKPFTMER